MGEHAKRFTRALQEVNAAAGPPSLRDIVEFDARQTRPVRFKDSTLSNWLRGESVPGSARAVAVLTAYLEHRASGSPGHVRRDPAEWQRLWIAARAERQAGRGRRTADAAPVVVQEAVAKEVAAKEAAVKEIAPDKCIFCDDSILASTARKGSLSSMCDVVKRAQGKHWDYADRSESNMLRYFLAGADTAETSLCFVHRIHYLDVLHHLFMVLVRDERNLSDRIVPRSANRTALPKPLASDYRLQVSAHLTDESRLLLCDELMEDNPLRGRSASSREPGLSGLSSLLTSLGRGGQPSLWSERISRVHRAVLSHPIAGSADIEDDGSRVSIPKIEDAYLDPAFRVATAKKGCLPQSDEWWKAQEHSEAMDHQLASYLAGCALNPRILLVLGDPGAGKSLLTKLVAARVPAADFVPIRVELRHSRAGGDVMAQLTQAVRELLQTEDPSVTWSSVAAFAPEQMPVLLFDGFDELLQAGKTDHFDYLNKLAAFQQRAMDNGRPVAIVVTSRTVVADLAAIPAGTVMLRLEPFDTKRIDQWIERWNWANHDVETMRPALERTTIQDFENLAQQPLLLFMLSLYFTLTDASDVGGSSRVDLYERLLRLFMVRQVKKVEPGLRPTEVAVRVERELDYLSTVATGMFARGKQGLTTSEAEYDLEHLVAGNGPGVPASKLLFGRFFFIHDAQEVATDGTTTWHWYEFLHATFGEYLVARRIARALDDSRDGKPDLGLYAVLSNSLLTDRDQIMRDLHALSPDRSKVPELLASALEREPAAPGSGYRPKPTTVTRRLAYFSANLVLLALSAGGDWSVSRLFPQAGAPGLEWSARTAFWHSQFSSGEWETFTRAIARTPDSKGVWGPQVLLRWPAHPVGADAFTFEPDSALSFSEPGDHLLRRVRMLHDPSVERVLEPVLPFFRRYGDLLGDFEVNRDGLVGSPGSALMTLAAVSSQPDLPTNYLRAVDHLSLREASPTWRWCFEILLRAFIADRDRLSAAQRQEVLSLIADLSNTDPGASNRETLMNLILAEVHGKGRPADAAWARLPHMPHAEAERWTPEEVLSWILAGAAPGRLPVRVLKRAIELDLVEWCTDHAAHIVEGSDDEALSALTPLDRWYLQNRVGVAP